MKLEAISLLIDKINKDTFEEALIALNEKLMPLYRNDVWQSAVYDALARINEVSDASYGIKVAIDRNDEALLGPNLKI